MRTFEIEGTDIAVVHYQDRFYAFAGRCTHEAYLMNYTRVRPGDLIICSSHLAVFELESGRVVSGPTENDLPTYSVQVEADDVFVNTDPLPADSERISG